jgi:hypothetical protein
MTAQLMRRFPPSAYSPREPFLRATETPREVRHLAEAVIAWTHGNILRDRESPLGDLPTLHEFRRVRAASSADGVRTRSR